MVSFVCIYLQSTANTYVILLWNCVQQNCVLLISYSDPFQHIHRYKKSLLLFHVLQRTVPLRSYHSNWILQHSHTTGCEESVLRDGNKQLWQCHRWLDEGSPYQHDRPKPLLPPRAQIHCTVLQTHMHPFTFWSWMFFCHFPTAWCTLHQGVRPGSWIPVWIYRIIRRLPQV